MLKIFSISFCFIFSFLNLNYSALSSENLDDNALVVRNNQNVFRQQDHIENEEGIFNTLRNNNIFGTVDTINEIIIFGRLGLYLCGAESLVNGIDGLARISDALKVGTSLIKSGAAIENGDYVDGAVHGTAGLLHYRLYTNSNTPNTTNEEVNDNIGTKRKREECQQQSSKRFKSNLKENLNKEIGRAFSFLKGTL